MVRRTTRRAVLASTGLTLTAGSGISVGGQETETDDRGTSVGASTGPSASQLREKLRYPRTRMNDGIVVQLDNCSQVRIYGDSSKAAHVSIFTYSYTPEGTPWDGVLDLEADLPMSVDVNRAYGDNAGSAVVIGGVDVTDADGEQLVTMQPPDGWRCVDEVEPPTQDDA